MASHSQQIPTSPFLGEPLNLNQGSRRPENVKADGKFFANLIWFSFYDPLSVLILDVAFIIGQEHKENT